MESTNILFPLSYAAIVMRAGIFIGYKCIFIAWGKMKPSVQFSDAIHIMVYVIYTAIPIFSKTRRLQLIFKPMLPMFVKS
ncbi:hypothetical protein D822_02629 [Streptococcus ratti FA-1 = DSM 20564]|uniref:Uncharacterized protein n=1 Tax=Streptococcus ratti FA-1 = DSM 20564 TaxID=699248 RepID=A0ABP2R192_STRRT|nr:hypothetical protein SRA_07441 [Streptococcus ratti FA-1 = DSM 20564]EMP71007.1 hypothetical protein D822_02629 [Streptococcus ratti FA-1 = DSM 20564]